jgi:hypothetical protein
MQKWKGGFQNFKDKKLIHNPNDGRLYVAELDDKGKVKEGPLGMVPMSTLVEVKNFDDKKIDVLAETNRYAEQMKPFVELIRSGKIESLEALSNMPNFNDFVNNVTEAIAKNENGYASILTDTDGTYKITGEGASSGKGIGLKNNGAGRMIPIIDTDMTKRTRDIIKEYLIAQTGIKETGTAVFSPSRGTEGGTGKGTKPQDIPSVGKVVPMYGKTTNKLQGPAFSVSNIRINKGPGLMQEIGGAALRDGQLVITGYLVEGKETASSDTDYGKGGFTVTKKTKFMSNPIIKGKRTKAEGLWSDVNGAQMENIITRIPIPVEPGENFTGETFSSVAQAIKFLEEKQQGMSPTRPVKNTEYTNITETNKGTIGVKNGKWYNIKTGNPI